jgi:hypothetical protein
LALAVCSAGPARADLITPDAIKLLLANVSQSGPVFTYTYTAKLTADAEIHAGAQTVGGQLSLADGDYVGIFDIPGYVPGSVQIASPLLSVGGGTWLATEPLTGLQPAPILGATSTDDPNQYNVDFQYVGADGGSRGTQTIYAGSSELVLGQVSFESTNPLSSVANVHYSAEDFDGEAMLEESNQGLLYGPAAANWDVPEPATLWPLAMAALVTILSRRRRTGA